MKLVVWARACVRVAASTAAVTSETGIGARGPHMAEGNESAVTLSHFSQQLFDTLANILHTAFRCECSCIGSCNTDAVMSMPRLAIYFRVQIHMECGEHWGGQAQPCVVIIIVYLIFMVFWSVSAIWHKRNTIDFALPFRLFLSDK